MPRQPALRSYEDRLDQLIMDSIDESVDRYATEQAPADTRTPSDAEQVAQWGTTDPNADYDAIYTRLLSGGMPPEEAQGLELVRQIPETVAVFADPMAVAESQNLPLSAVADVAARFAEHPFRPRLFLHLDPKDRVKEAQRINRLWQKSLTMDEPEGAS